MLARSSETIPAIGHLYEPKLDGFRGLAVLRRSGVQLLSRRGRDLGVYFPELLAALDALPPQTVLDGEVVAVSEGGCDFGALCRRLNVPRGLRDAAAATTAVCFCAFDILSDAGEDTWDLPLVQRRRRLERLLGPAVDLDGASPVDRAGSVIGIVAQT